MLSTQHFTNSSLPRGKRAFFPWLPAFHQTDPASVSAAGTSLLATLVTDSPGIFVLFP